MFKIIFPAVQTVESRSKAVLAGMVLVLSACATLAPEREEVVDQALPETTEFASSFGEVSGWTEVVAQGAASGLAFSSAESIGIRRLEAGILDNGTDMDPSMTPYEAGIGFVRFYQKGNWLGRKLTLCTQEGGQHACEIVSLPFYDAGKMIPRGLDDFIG